MLQQEKRELRFERNAKSRQCGKNFECARGKWQEIIRSLRTSIHAVQSFLVHLPETIVYNREKIPCTQLDFRQMSLLPQYCTGMSLWVSYDELSSIVIQNGKTTTDPPPAATTGHIQRTLFRDYSSRRIHKHDKRHYAGSHVRMKYARARSGQCTLGRNLACRALMHFRSCAQYHKRSYSRDGLLYFIKAETTIRLLYHSSYYIENTKFVSNLTQVSNNAKAKRMISARQMTSIGLEDKSDES